jgi:hypothetical protein
MRKISWLFFLVVIAVACRNDQFFPEEPDASSEAQKTRVASGARLFTETGVNCHESRIISMNANGTPTGTIEFSVDEVNIYITYDLTGSEWFLTNEGAFAGDCGAIPAPGDFPHQQSFPTDDEVRYLNFAIPLAGLPDCGCISLAATVARFNSSTSQVEQFSSPNAMDYCNCEEPEEPDDKDLRTQTPGGWGTLPQGNNPGAYLHANFAAAFPEGLVVGCDHTITLTSAQAVSNFLPQGGTPSSLTMSYLNPVNAPKSANNPKNVLAGHIVALTLSVGFDDWDEAFGESNTSLANAVVTTGAFEGWTVAQVLAEAENILGGCDSSYSASAITEVLSAINESFTDGTTNTGFLMNGN